MSVLDRALFFLPSLAYRRHAAVTLATALAPQQAAPLWQRARALRAELSRKRPRYGVGLNLLMRYMEWSAALYGALREAGFSEHLAGQMVEATNWAAIGPASALSFRFSRVASNNPVVRGRWITDRLFGFLFTAPFRRVTYDSPAEIAFDVLACPLAQYFKERRLPELTRYAACRLDHHMARQWGLVLQRQTTIANEFPLCDFRFRIQKG